MQRKRNRAANAGAAGARRSGRNGARRGTPRRVERVGGEDMIDDSDPLVVREREIDVRVRDEVDRQRVAGRAADRQARASALRARPRRRRTGRSAATGPPGSSRSSTATPPPSGARRRSPAARRRRLRCARSSDRRTRLRGLRGRPVESSWATEAWMLLPAAAVEADAVDGRVRRAGQPLQQPERREGHVGLLPPGTGERVPGCERVVHRHMLIDAPDGPGDTLYRRVWRNIG